MKSNSALLLSHLVEHPTQTWTVSTLLHELDLEEKEDNLRRLRIYMGTVSRRLCLEHGKILLHSGREY
jgi:DNA-binding response OmpR family regulator